MPELNQPQRGLVGRAFRWLWNEPLACVFLGLVCLVVLFYVEEDWRGKRAWLKCKRELEAKGAVLTWDAYIPPEVPDSQNIFKAPKMMDWFGRRGPNELTGLLNVQSLSRYAAQSNSSPFAQISIISTGVPPPSCDLLLRYDPPFLTWATPPDNLTNSTSGSSTLIPLIVLEQVALTAAITNLARAAGINYFLDPEVTSPRFTAQGQPVAEAIVSMRWTDVTAREALVDLLNHYGLRLLDNPRVGLARIVVRKSTDPQVYVDPALREKLRSLVRQSLWLGTNDRQTLVVTGAQNLLFVAHRPSAPPIPGSIVAVAAKVPSTTEINEFFPRGLIESVAPGSGRARAEATGTNSFNLFLNPPSFYTAADYLAWSDQFEPAFQLIRDALKRPVARIEGDYHQPFLMPIPNFIAVRTISQMLSQRVQCHLLLDEPEKAVRDLALLGDLGHLLHGDAAGRPLTLVAAMIDVAVTGLYVATFAEGLRLHAWTPAQLATIQAQLEQVNLPRLVLRAFQQERAGVCRTFELGWNSDLLNRSFSSSGSSTGIWDKFKEPTFLFFTFAPRGWAYQNMVTTARLEERMIASFDPNRNMIAPRQLDQATREVDRTLHHPAPDTMLASVAIPNYTRAWQTMARTQTSANQAVVVCALERYRLTHGGYPENLAALVPDYIAKLPLDIIDGQPLRYSRTANGRFLLYSIGWNEKDDGGKLWREENGAINYSKGDWVWRIPLN